MDLLDLALDTKDKDWFIYLLTLPNIIDKELEAITDDFIEYFNDIAQTEGLTIRQLLSDIKYDTLGISDYERELYIECNFDLKYKKKILALLKKN